jgi:uncharacterized protein (TIGR00369 family)
MNPEALSMGMSADEIVDWFDAHFPSFRRVMRLESVEPGRARMRWLVEEQHLRPGGTVFGPSMMTLADSAMYAAILAVDRDCGGAVTSNFNISFLRRPAPCDLLADAELLKRGRRLLVGEVRIFSADTMDIVAHATVTYARP